MSHGFQARSFRHQTHRFQQLWIPHLHPAPPCTQMHQRYVHVISITLSEPVNTDSSGVIQLFAPNHPTYSSTPLTYTACSQLTPASAVPCSTWSWLLAAGRLHRSSHYRVSISGSCFNDASSNACNPHAIDFFTTPISLSTSPANGSLVHSHALISFQIQFSSPVTQSAHSLGIQIAPCNDSSAAVYVLQSRDTLLAKNQMSIMLPRYTLLPGHR